MATYEYSAADVERLIGLSRSVVRSLVRQGFIAPRRGKRREFAFSFQDLIVLRTAKALSNNHVPNRRIVRSLRQLRRHLPERAPISGLSIRAVGDAISVREGRGEWDSASGQYLLALDVVLDNGTLHVIDRPTSAPTDIEGLFEQALQLENADRAAAIHAYQRCLELDRSHLGARINCARLLHQGGDLANAERLYRFEVCLHDAGALFNLGVLLEDLERIDEAIETYLKAATLDPGLADAHYNLARLYEERGNDPQMIRHLQHYRRLTASNPDHA